MAKHILVVTQYYYPENFRINDICEELAKRGYKVTVITGIPNYPEGKFYKGYGWFKKRRETRNGVEIIRIPLISRGKSSLRLILNYYSFVFFGWFWKIFTRIKADAVFTFEVSPLIQAKIGVWYAEKRKIPHYLYVQDLWPENLEVVGGIRNKFVLKHYAKMAAKIYKKSDKIFATSPSFVEEIRKRLEKGAEKVIYLPQYAEEFYTPREKTEIGAIPNDDRVKIVFTGNIGYAQGLGILPKAAKLLKESGDVNVCFVIVGDGRYKEELKVEISENAVEEMFIFIERQPAEKMPEILSACDGAFLSFMDNALFEKTIPAKLQSYMACGKPIIAAASGETERIIKESGCGYVSPIGDEKELAACIKAFAASAEKETMSENAVEYYIANFKKAAFFEKLTESLGESEV